MFKFLLNYGARLDIKNRLNIARPRKVFIISFISLTYDLLTVSTNSEKYPNIFKVSDSKLYMYLEK